MQQREVSTLSYQMMKAILENKSASTSTRVFIKMHSDISKQGASKRTNPQALFKPLRTQN